MSPAVAKPLAAWLDLAASDYEKREGMRRYDDPPGDWFGLGPIDVLGLLGDSWQIRALEFARQINAANKPDVTPPPS
ncbi:hypothetical protein [Saccharopolyspora phatthalungensis]|uniref:Uncharacterized protein n=1 Tax=Saccharopolyspora phatthalungensis TaxID=664693 RepID=A0A840Q1I8_9PSEU|nr:hypothetical protein [Saccharopolyspora phatthalungensis]MBB5152609.1 hypothetical protein [Saccharopolyspora phatthalungensis]